MVVTQTMIDEAEAAYAALMTGRMTTKFKDSNGEEVTYNVANANKLAIYIQLLKSQFDTSGPGSGPMRVWF